MEVMVFADIVKFRGDQAGLGWALNGDRCPYAKLETHRAWRKRLCKDRGRDLSDIATSQGLPAAIRVWERQGSFSPGTLRKQGPKDTLGSSSGCQTEGTDVCCLSPQVVVRWWSSPRKPMLVLIDTAHVVPDGHATS